MTVTLSAEQVNVLEALAQARQSSLSALVRQVIAHGLAVDGVPVPAWLASAEPLAATPRPEKVSRGNR